MLYCQCFRMFFFFFLLTLCFEALWCRRRKMNDFITPRKMRTVTSYCCARSAPVCFRRKSAACVAKTCFFPPPVVGDKWRVVRGTKKKNTNTNNKKYIYILYYTRKLNPKPLPRIISGRSTSVIYVCTYGTAEETRKKKKRTLTVKTYVAIEMINSKIDRSILRRFSFLDDLQREVHIK